MTEQLDLTAEEKQALIALLRETLEYARFPLAPRLDPLKAILAKLEPPPSQPSPLPPLPAAGPRVGRGRRQGDANLAADLHSGPRRLHRLIRHLAR
jgi:hypothetical protein